MIVISDERQTQAFITFGFFERVVGRIEIADNGLSFTGDAAMSADIFFNHVIKRIADIYIAEQFAKRGIMWAPAPVGLTQ